MATNFGLNDSLEYTEFELDSFDCTQSYNSTYTVQNWPKFYLGKPLINVAAIKILEAQIPFTFYVINSQNNMFLLTEWTSSGTVSHTTPVYIPVGNYNYATLAPVLVTALNLASYHAYTYQVTFNTATLKFSFNNTDFSTAGDFFSFTMGSPGDNEQTSPRAALGFNGGTTTSTANQGGFLPSNLLVAPNVVQIGGPNYLYINSRNIGPLVKVFLPGNGQVNPVGSGADGPQVAKIPLTVNPGQVLNWQDPNPLMWFDMGNTTFSGTMDFYVTIGTGTTPVDFNGDSFSIKLGVLTNTASHNDYLGGGRQNGRATNKTWPTGTY